MNLKGLRSFKTHGLFAFFVTLVSGLTAYSQALGPAGTGGGTTIESKFDVRVKSLLEEIIAFPEEDLAQFSFSVDEVLTQISQPGSFNPICAPSDIIKLMQNKDKNARPLMALVFNENRNVVYLNCKDYSKNDWDSYFQTRQPDIDVFFLHEALRVAGIEVQHGDYSKSSVYARVKREQDKKFNFLVKRLLGVVPSGSVVLNKNLPTHTCKIHIASSGDDVTGVIFLVDDFIYRRATEHSLKETKTSFIDGSTKSTAFVKVQEVYDLILQNNINPLAAKLDYFSKDNRYKIREDFINFRADVMKAIKDLNCVPKE